MERYDPTVVKLAYVRYSAPGRRSGKQFFTNQHKLKLWIEDGNDKLYIHDEAQAVAALRLVREWARVAGIKEFWFSKDELRLLARGENSPPFSGNTTELIKVFFWIGLFLGSLLFGAGWLTHGKPEKALGLPDDAFERVLGLPDHAIEQFFGFH